MPVKGSTHDGVCWAVLLSPTILLLLFVCGVVVIECDGRGTESRIASWVDCVEVMGSTVLESNAGQHGACRVRRAGGHKERS